MVISLGILRRGVKLGNRSRLGIGNGDGESARQGLMRWTMVGTGLRLGIGPLRPGSPVATSTRVRIHLLVEVFHQPLLCQTWAGYLSFQSPPILPPRAFSTLLPLPTISSLDPIPIDPCQSAHPIQPLHRLAPLCSIAPSPDPAAHPCRSLAQASPVTRCAVTVALAVPTFVHPLPPAISCAMLSAVP